VNVGTGEQPTHWQGGPPLGCTPKLHGGRYLAERAPHQNQCFSAHRRLQPHWVDAKAESRSYRLLLGYLAVIKTGAQELTEDDILRIIAWALSSSDVVLIVGGENGPVWPKLDSGRVEDPPAVIDQADGKRAVPVPVVSRWHNLQLPYLLDWAAKCSCVCQYTIQYFAKGETHSRTILPTASALKQEPS